MSVSEWEQLAKSGDLDAFELRCMETVENGGLTLAPVAGAFERLGQHENRDRVAAIGKLLLEHANDEDDPPATLRVAHTTLLCTPKDETLRQRVTDLYTRVHGDTPGFDRLLDVSGLTSGRPARNALRLLKICLGLRAGDALISRTEGAVVEVKDVDLASGLFTLDRGGRPVTVPALDLSREYERADPDDFRVLRALRPDRLNEQIEKKPVSVVIGLLHAHEGVINQDVLKHELVPRHIEPKAWAKWWTRTRSLLKRCPNVIVEGRTPVVLSYTATARTLEHETWEAFDAEKEPVKWLAIIDGYLREKKTRKEEPDVKLLGRFHEHMVNGYKAAEARRPGEALACALIAERLDEQANLPTDEGRQLAVTMLRDAEDPAALIVALDDTALWGLGLDALAAGRGEDAAQHATKLVRRAPAQVLDKVIAIVASGNKLDEVQPIVDMAAAEPVHHPEIVYWLWKGPAKVDGLALPAMDELFTNIVRTLSTLGRTLNPGESAMRTFRLRIRTALALRDFARAKECIERIDEHRAVTLRRQLERLEGVGDVVRIRLVEILRDQHPHLWAKPIERIETWADPDVLWSTAEGIRVKTEERDELVNVKMRENAVRIGEAASHGDLSENSEYKFALEERDFLRARLASMNQQLSISQAIEPDGVPTDRVGVGSRVKLRRVDDGAEREMTFLGPFDTDVEHGSFNYKAPVSQKLMGLSVGERVELSLEGADETFEVLEITNGMMPAGTTV